MTYGSDYRRRVTDFVKEGGSKREAARLFRVSRETVYQWLELGDALAPKPLRSRQRKLDKAALVRHVKENPDALLRERAAHFGVHVNAVWTALKKQKLVKKTA